MKKENLAEEEHALKGLEKANLGNYKEALTEYDFAIELKPDYAVAYNDRSVVKSILGDHKGAMSDINKCLELKSMEAHKVYNSRGCIKRDAGDIKGSLLDYNKSIELKPDYALAYLNRALVRLKLGDLEGAKVDYDMVIKLKPKSSAAYRERAVVKARIGDYEGALADLDKSDKLKPEDNWAPPGTKYIVEEDISPAEKARPPKRKGRLSFDEKKDAKDRRQLTEADYLDAMLNMQMSTETYLYIRILQKFGYRYADAARALDIPITTLHSATQRVLRKLKKSMSSGF